MVKTTDVNVYLEIMEGPQGRVGSLNRCGVHDWQGIPMGNSTWILAYSMQLDTYLDNV
ncbi:hypothetical protein AAAZ63_21445 [Bacteroides xylanisolvens]|uniref:hypothetical protein n=1 Tax=Bacteroides xylanisolvens TaxID=371601 RepID=UPI0032C0DC81